MKVLHAYWWDPVEDVFRWVLKDGSNFRWAPGKGKVWRHNGKRWRALGQRRAVQARDVMLHHAANEYRKIGGEE